MKSKKINSVISYGSPVRLQTAPTGLGKKGSGFWKEARLNEEKINSVISYGSPVRLQTAPTGLGKIGITSGGEGR